MQLFVLNRILSSYKYLAFIPSDSYSQPAYVFKGWIVCIHMLNHSVTKSLVYKRTSLC